MKKTKLPIVNHTVMTQLAERGFSVTEEAFYGRDKRKLVIVRRTCTALAVNMRHKNKNYFKTFGHVPDLKWKEFDKQASDFIADVLNDRINSVSNITLRQHYLDMVLPMSIVEHKDTKGFQQRLETLLDAYGDYKLSAVEKHHIVKLLNELTEGRETSTLARYLAAYSRFFSTAVDNGLLERNPCKGIKRPKENPSRTRLIAQEEVRALIEGVFTYKNQTMALSVLLCLFSGQRQGNIRSIELSWFNSDYTQLRFPTSKSGKPLTVYLSPIAIEIVKLALKYSDGTYLFPSHIPNQHIGKPTRCITYLRKFITDKTGITEHWYAHDLRKRFATSQMQACGDLNIVREMLGHADLKTTLIYTLTNNERLVQANTNTAESLLGCSSLTSFIKNLEE
mgnify:CR=1 FL=1|tara:strand:+ start:12394 stop:13575 length:1182 start_codon:yes stop_codon:yes gene_type:complete